MGGTTAKASLITRGVPAIEDGYIIGGEASGQPMQLRWSTSSRSAPAAARSPGSIRPAAACRAKERRRRPRPGLLWQRLGRSGGDRRQPRAWPHQRRALPQWRDVARPCRRRAGDRGKVAGRLRLGVTEAALGIVQIADSAMSLAVRAVSVKKGVDPRETAMIAFAAQAPCTRSRSRGRFSFPR